MIELHLFPLSLAYQQERYLRQLIPALQLQHWQRRRQHADQLRSILAHAATRLLLADKLHCSPLAIRFQLEPQGKPVISYPDSAWHMNISHSGQWVVVALAPFAVGVDIEQHAGAPDTELIRSCFTPQEQQSIHSTEDFYRAWCAKEAALKAAGTGFTISPLELELVPTSAAQAQVHSPHPILNGLHVGSRLWHQSYSLAWCSQPPQGKPKYVSYGLSDLQKHIKRHVIADNLTNICNSSHYHEQ